MLIGFQAGYLPTPCINWLVDGLEWRRTVWRTSPTSNHQSENLHVKHRWSIIRCSRFAGNPEVTRHADYNRNTLFSKKWLEYFISMDTSWLCIKILCSNMVAVDKEKALKVRRHFVSLYCSSVAYREDQITFSTVNNLCSSRMGLNESWRSKLSNSMWHYHICFYLSTKTTKDLGAPHHLPHFRTVYGTACIMRLNRQGGNNTKFVM